MRFKNMPILHVDPPAGGDKPNGGGGGTTTIINTSTTPDPQRQQEQTPTQAAVAACIARYRGAENAVAELMAQTYRLRRGKRIIEGKATPDEIRAVLPEGFSLLSKDEAAEFAAFRALGKLDEVKSKVENEAKLKNQLSEQAREAIHRDAAEATGFAPAVLTKIAKSEGLHIEVRDETVDGKVVKKAFARKADKANDPLMPLTEYAEKHLAEFLPALKATGNNQQQTSGVRMPAQQQSKPGQQQQGPTDKASAFIAKRNERASKVVNPLMPAAPTK